MGNADQSVNKGQLLRQQIDEVTALLRSRDEQIETLTSAIESSKQEVIDISYELSEQRKLIENSEQARHITDEGQCPKTRLHSKFEQVSGLLKIVEEKAESIDDITASIVEKRKAIAERQKRVHNQRQLLESMHTQLVELVELVGKQGEGLSYLEKGGDITEGLGVGMPDAKTKLSKLKMRMVALRSALERTQEGAEEAEVGDEEEGSEEGGDLDGVSEGDLDIDPAGVAGSLSTQGGFHVQIQNNLLCTIL